MEFISSILFNLAAFIFVLTIIVFAHEFGHYIVAKLSGVKVEQFSIGFGRELFGFNDKSGTRWKFCLWPLGGFVKMFGDINPASVPDKENLTNMTEEEKKLAFHTKSLPIKAAVVAAGPLANFIFALILLAGYFVYYGKPETKPIISDIIKDSAAQKAGFLVGDEIISMDGTKTSSFGDIQRIIALNTGSIINFQIKRSNENITINTAPIMKLRKDIFGNELKLPTLGIASNEIKLTELGFFESLGEASLEIYHISVSTLKALGQMVTGSRDLSEITGPIGIAKYSGQSANSGAATLIWFMVILSVNLGLVNLFPIPVLDGGHLLYYSIEAVRGKPMADKYQLFGFRIGIAIVISLAVFAVINDIIKIIN